MFKFAVSLFVSFGLLWPMHAAAANAPAPSRLFTVHELKEDLRFMRAEIARIHPDLSFSVSPERLDAAFKDIEAQLDKPMSGEQAFRILATLNPIFADGHLQVGQPDWRKQTHAHLQAGGTLFPFELLVDAAGTILIRSDLGSETGALAGTVITAINGVPAERVARALLAITPGDTPELRANLLSRRAWLAYRSVFGSPGQYDLALATPSGPQHLRVAGSRAVPLALPEETFEQTFSFERLPGNAALLTVNDFNWPDKQRFYAFTRDVFTRLRAENVDTLLIDVRENRGGDDDMWINGILPYIADKPFRHASAYVKKVIAGRESDSEKVGDVVRGPLTLRSVPVDPLRFRGKTYVMVGRTTYSSAVLFANVVQDFGYGKLVGEAGYARTRQSGGIQILRLPHTGMEFVVPRFILERPAGGDAAALVRPDIVLPDSAFDKRALIDALLRRPVTAR